MEIPEYVRRDGIKYKFVKKYPKFYLYKSTKAGVLECFKDFDLGLIKEQVIVHLRKNMNIKP